MKETIETTEAPKALGPYSQGCEASGEFVFVSGQVGLTPDGELKNTGSIEEETHQVFDNVQAILGATALDLSNVVKVTVYITDAGDFSKVNAVYNDRVPQPYPARECVVVKAIPLPGARVEISAIAVRNPA